MWDANSQMLVAIAIVPLRGLLRQGKDTEVLSLSVDLRNEKTNTNVGTLQLMLRNEGEVLHIGEREQFRGRTRFDKDMDEGFKTKRKVKSYKPMNLQSELRLSEDPKNLDEDHRKALRVSRYKMVQAQERETARNKSNREKIDSVLSKNNIDDEDAFRKTMREIAVIREKKKADLISNNTRVNVDHENKVNVNFGEAKIVSYKITNDSVRCDKDFVVKIVKDEGF